MWLKPEGLFSLPNNKSRGTGSKRGTRVVFKTLNSQYRTGADKSEPGPDQTAQRHPRDAASARLQNPVPGSRLLHSPMMSARRSAWNDSLGLPFALSD